MNMMQYQNIEVRRTLSDSFHAQNASPEYLAVIFGACITVNTFVDAYKKAIFYGKVPPGGLPGFAEVTTDPAAVEAAKSIDMTKGNINLLHAALGMVGESIEFFEEVMKTFVIGVEIDEEHAREEMGDVMWYQAIANRELNTDFEDRAEANIAKLRKRYPHNFTEADAIAGR